MGRRRGRNRRSHASEPAAASTAQASAAGERPSLVSWRERLGSLLDTLEQWMRERAAAEVEANERALFGDAETLPEDRMRALLDLAVRPGLAGATGSLAETFAQERQVEPAELEQIRRWARERRRGVFLLQRAERDRLLVWDPLEGAPLTLHLLQRLDATQAGRLLRGTVLTASFQPWMARLVAVGQVEFFVEAKARRLFQEQVVESGRVWHEAPPPAPVRTD